MKHHYPSTKLVSLDITWTRPVEYMPPQRKLHNIQHEGVGFWPGGYTFKLAKLEFEDVRENFKKYPRDLPEFQGNVELVQYWVDSIWEALYNPMWFRWVQPVDFLEHPNPKKRGRVPSTEYQLLHGHHRLRLFDALGASHIWVYMVTGHHHGSDRPPELRRLLKLNDRPPRRGTRTARCAKCEAIAPVSSRKYSEFNIKRWYTCPRCGHFDDEYQPYPERI